MSYQIIRTDIHDTNFKAMVQLLDAELRLMYGDQQDDFDPHNKLSEDTDTLIVKHQNQTIGESTIAGVGAKEHKDAFTGALADELSQQSSYKINWKVVAKSGFTAREVAEKLIPQTAGLQPDIIVIGLGANDAFQFNSPKAWRKGIESVIKQLHQKFPEAPIVFIGMAPIHAFPAFTKTIQFVIGKAIDLLGNELELIAQQYSFVFYDNRKILIEDWLPKVKGATSINDFFSDGVHPSEGTYQVWGQEVGKFILESNCLPIR